jgi:cell division protein FtsI/penicillin-binding protein 2
LDRFEDSRPPRQLTLLVAPIALAFSLAGLRALGQSAPIPAPLVVDGGSPAACPAVALAAVDAGPQALALAAAADEADDDTDDSGLEGEGGDAQFDGKIPSITSLAAYPDVDDLLSHATLGEDGRFTVQKDGKAVPLTLDDKLTKRLEAILKSFQTPYAAIAAIEPATGRVLALAEYSHDQPAVKHLSLRAVYPAASVFKIVTAATLLEKGVDPSKETCFHGGHHRIQAKLLEDTKGDGRCVNMTDAFANSVNVVFAKQAKKHLKPEDLRSEAGRLGFNRPLGFEQPMEKSVANIPETPFEFATTAAGFGQVFLSPLHGALLAATVANRGHMPTPTVLEGAQTGPGKAVMSEKVADQLGDMMVKTVASGTARRSFHERGKSVLSGLDVCGKTGSIDEQKPFHDYTWFVGFAPREAPKVALAVVIVNGPKWRVRAPYVAREAFKAALFPEPEKPKRQARKTK